MAPPEADWLAIKPTLFKIWFGGQPFNQEFIDHVKEEHGFSASKNQYERKFGEWGWKKNLSKDQWGYVLPQIKMRERLGKKSEVTLDVGDAKVVIPLERIRKRKYRLEEVEAETSKVSEVFNFPEISVHTPRPVAEDASGAKYKRPDSFEITLSSSNFAARGRSSKKICLGKSNQPGTVLKNIQGLPFVELMRFMGSLDHSNLKELTLCPSESYEETGKFRLYENDPEFSRRNHALNLVFRNPDIVQHVGESVRMFVYGMFCKGPTNIALSPGRLLVKFNRLQHSLLDIYDGEAKERLNRILNPAVVSNAFNEVLTMAIQLGSNSNLDYAQRDILCWLGRKSAALLQALFEVKLPSVRAFLDQLINSACCFDPKTFKSFISIVLADSEVHAARKLLDADKHHNLFAGNKLKKMVVALNLDHVEMVGILLRHGVDPNAAINIRGVPTTQLAAANSIQASQLLIKFEADINAIIPVPLDIKDGKLNPRTALECAVYGKGRGFDFLARYLLTVGARPILINSDGKASLLIERFPKDDWSKLRPLETHDLETYRALRQSQFRVNFVIDWFMVHKAAREGDDDYLAQCIAAYKADNKALHLGDPWTSVLELAIVSNRLAVVALLLKHHINVNARIYSPYGGSPLELAQGLGHLDIKFQLLLHDAKACAEDPTTPETLPNTGYLLQMALEGRIDLGQLLDIADDFYNPSICRVDEEMHNVLRIIQLILAESGVAASPRIQQRVLRLAILTDQLQYATYLIRYGTSLTPMEMHDKYQSNTFLQLASSRAHNGLVCVQLVQLMLQMGAMQLEPEPKGCRGYKALQNAIVGGLQLDHVHNGIGLKTAQILLEAGVNVNAQPPQECDGMIIIQKSALQTVIERSNLLGENRGRHKQKVLDFLKFMISIGADVNAIASVEFGSKNGTALQLAMMGDINDDDYDFTVVSLLINSGAKINAPANIYCGRTAIQAAISQKEPSEKIIDFLLHRGADIHAPAAMIRGITALQGAAIQGHIKIVKQLLEMGADPNAPGAEDYGRTALEGAAQRGRLDTVVLLLTNGAKPTEKAAKFAENEFHCVIAEIVRERLAES